MDRSTLALNWYPQPRYWSKEAVFLLGGGPSLRGFDFSLLAGRNVIAINVLGYDWLAHASKKDILFGHDCGFFEASGDLIYSWPGLILTTSEDASVANPNRIYQLRVRPSADLACGGQYIKSGPSSGHTAISLAIALGASLVVLLGFDMRIVNGRSHSHDRYRQEDEAAYRNDFIPSFRGWRVAAQRLGVEIINATPGSDLYEFRRSDLANILAMQRR